MVLNRYCKKCRKKIIILSNKIIKIIMKLPEDLLLAQVEKELHIIRLQTRLKEIYEEKLDRKYF